MKQNNPKTVNKNNWTTIYRQANPSDVHDIQYVLSTTWEETYTHLSSEIIQQVKENWHSTEHLTNQIENKECFFPIALVNGKVAGIASSGMNEEGVVDLFRLYILPEYQSKGIGSELLSMIEKKYPKATKIAVSVDENNDAGIRYYERRGFKKIKQEKDDSFDEVMTEWLMEKDF